MPRLELRYVFSVAEIYLSMSVNEAKRKILVRGYISTGTMKIGKPSRSAVVLYLSFLMAVAVSTSPNHKYMYVCMGYWLCTGADSLSSEFACYFQIL